ncbi:unnamed protein product [Laminaria digitata]
MFRSQPSGAFAEWTASAVGKAREVLYGMCLVIPIYPGMISTRV